MASLQSLAARVGGLSNPSKMPGYSWSIPATRCQLGAILAQQPGSTCHGCYALKGSYSWRSTKNAMERRYAALMAALETPETRARWVADWVAILEHRERRTLRNLERGKPIGRDDGRFFRWHDSGDIQSVAHLAVLADIARAVPGVRFWLPTREAGMVKRFLAGNTLPDNLRVRLSTPRIDQPTPAGFESLRRMAPGLAVSGVHTGNPLTGFEACSAPERAGHCGDCRACWGADAVSYKKH